MAHMALIAYTLSLEQGGHIQVACSKWCLYCVNSQAAAKQRNVCVCVCARTCALLVLGQNLCQRSHSQCNVGDSCLLAVMLI